MFRRPDTRTDAPPMRLRPEPIGTLHPVRPLGRGGMGEVWLYHDKALGIDRAVKFLLPERAGDPALRARFAAEARTLAALGQTPGIVRVHAAGEIPKSGLPYFVMDAHLLSAAQVRLVCTRRLGLPSPAAEAVVRTLAATHAEFAEDGSHAENAEPARVPFTLQDALGDEATGTARQLPERTVLRLASEIAAALARLHGRTPPIVHRDLKPANLLFDADGRLLLADFGVAKALDPARTGLTRTGAQPGSHRYAAPEQRNGAPATPASDWYALGVILYRALTSSFPEWGERFPTSAGLRFFSPRWEPLLLDLIARDPARRLSSPSVFLNRLDRIERHLERPPRHTGRSTLAVAAAAVALGLAAVVTTCVASRDKAPDHSEAVAAAPAEPAPPAPDATGGGGSSGEAKPPPVAPPATTTRPPPGREAGPVPEPSGSGSPRTPVVTRPSAPHRTVATRPTGAGAGTIDEARFAALRDLTAILRVKAREFADATNGIVRPRVAPDGTVRIRAGDVVSTEDVLTAPGARRVVLDGGELLFAQPTDALAKRHAEIVRFCARAEAGELTADEIRSPPDFPEPSMTPEDLRPFPLPVEIGPGGGWITGHEAPYSPDRGRWCPQTVITGPITASPEGAGPIWVSDVRFAASGFGGAPVLHGRWSVWEDPENVRKDARPIYPHAGADRPYFLTEPSFWNRNDTGEKPEARQRRLLEMTLERWSPAFEELLPRVLPPVPDASGDLAVPKDAVLVVGDLPDDGSVKRILLLGGEIVFALPSDRMRAICDLARRPSAVAADPSAAERLATPVAVQALSVPILVGKEGGSIRRMGRENSATNPRFHHDSPVQVDEARLLSPVEHEFGERPELFLDGGVLVDTAAFDRAIPVAVRDDRTDREAPAQSIDAALQDGTTFWLCDFSGPFPKLVP